MSNIKDRKKQHIELAKNPDSQMDGEIFSDFKLPYKALPEINLKDVSTETTLYGKNLSQPLIIASMTGGTENSGKINTNLAIATEETGVAFGVGSQRICLEIEEARKSFEIVRKYAPNAFIFANMGAIQLKHGYGFDEYNQAIDMIKADALYLHINSLQEAIQPEGDTDFEGLLDLIAELLKKVQVPVFVKEVGHGMDEKTIEVLADIGVGGIDVAGANGTSWAWIEGKRKGSGQLAKWFKNEGIPTEDSLGYAAKYKDKVKIVASGGVRNPIQGLKAGFLGADYYSAAYPFLEPALESPEKLVELIEEWQRGLRVGLFYCGKARWGDF